MGRTIAVNHQRPWSTKRRLILPEMSHGKHRKHGNPAPHPDCGSPPQPPAGFRPQRWRSTWWGEGNPNSGRGAGVRGFRGFRGYSIGTPRATAAWPSPEMPVNLTLHFTSTFLARKFKTSPNSHGNIPSILSKNLCEKPQHFFLERYENAYRLELDNFIQCVRGEGEPLADIHDGLQALVLAEAAIQSHETGQTVAL